MADEEDKESKTEDATPKRIEDALEKGNTPFSREVGGVATLFAIGLGLPILAPHMSIDVSSGLRMFLDKSSEFDMETGGDVLSVMWMAGRIMIVGMWPLLAGLIVVGLLGALLQNPPRLVLHRIKPDFSRISPAKGATRIMGLQGQVEFLKSLVKITVIALILYFSLKGSPERLLLSVRQNYTELPFVMVKEISGLFLTAGLCLAGLALADLLWTRAKWHMDLRMSKQELKEEHKQSEGDPIVRARQRSIARDRARRRMISAVPQATLVIANPTHYAVAMRYVHGESAVPIVVAKGVDHLALRIRKIAEEHDIPVVEDRALARSLYEAVKTDRPVPPEFYRAVAEIILFLMSRRGARLEHA